MSTKKIMAFAIVAMFVATGMVTVVGNCVTGISGDNEGDLVEIYKDGSSTPETGITGLDSPRNALYTAIMYVRDQHDKHAWQIKLLSDFENGAVIEITPGYTVANNLNIDFNGKTYTVTGEAQNAFTVSKLSDEVVLSNGTIKIKNSPAETLVWCNTNLTLNNMVIDGTGLTGKGSVESLWSLKQVEGNITINTSKKPVTDANADTATTKIIGVKNVPTGCTSVALEIYSTSPIMFNENVIIDGNLNGFFNSFPIIVNGYTEISNGNVIDVSDNPCVIEIGYTSSIKFCTGVTNFNTTINGSGAGMLFDLKSVVAMNDGVVFYNDQKTPGTYSTIQKPLYGVRGDVKGVETGSSVLKPLMMEGMGIEGTIGEFLSLSLYVIDTITLTKDLTIMKNATLIEREEGQIIGTGMPHLIFKADSTQVINPDITKFKEDTYFVIDENGGQKNVFRAVLTPTEHVTSITYNGQSFIEFDENGIQLKLSEITVVTDEGYKLTGFKVNGVEKGINDTVKITGNCEITAIVEADEPVPPTPPTPPTPTDDGSTFDMLGIILGAIVALIALFFVFCIAKND